MLHLYIVEVLSEGFQKEMSKFLNGAIADHRISIYTESCFDKSIDEASFIAGLKQGINFDEKGGLR